MREIIASIRVLARSETLNHCQYRTGWHDVALKDLVVLRVPLVRVWCLFQPLLVLGNSEEVDALLSLGNLRECVRECTFTRNPILLTRTMGVTNSTKKLGIFNRDGKK